MIGAARSRRGDIRTAMLAALPRPTASRRYIGGAAVLVVGERGIGKLTLLEEAASAARGSGFRVLHTAGSEAESLLQFAGLQRLLNPLMHVSGQLPSAHREALLTALGQKDGPPPDRFLVSMAARNLVIQAARTSPMLIAVDDLDHLDVSSRDVVTFLARRLERHPVAVLATASDTGVIRDSVSGYTEHLLPRLGPAESAQMLDELAAGLDSRQRTWVTDLAAGNPLALVELKLAGDGVSASTDPLDRLVTLSPTLERAFAGRVDKLSGVERDALLVAALASEDSTQEILAATQLLAGTAVTTEVLDPSVFLGLLTYDESQVRFHHPLTRSAVVSRESISRWQSAHRALGFTVNVNSYRRIWHQASSTSGPDGGLAAALEEHARQASWSGNPDRAMRLLCRAAALTSSEPERGRRLLAAAGQALALGQFAEAQQLHAEATATDLTELERMRAEVMGHEFGAAFTQDDRRGRLIAAAVQARRNGEDGTGLEFAYIAAFRAYLRPAERGDLALIRPFVLDSSRTSQDERRIAVAALLDPIGSASQLIPVLRSINERALGLDRLLELAVACRAVGDYARGLELLALAGELAASRSLNGTLGRVLGLTADMALETGDWSIAREALSRAVAFSPSGVDSDRRANLLATVAKAAALSGEPDEALQVAARIELMVSAAPRSSALAKAQIARGIAAVVQGRHQDAVVVLQRVFDPEDPRHHPVEQFAALTYVVEAASRCGRADLARTIVDRVTRATEDCSSPLLIAQLKSAQAILAPDEDADARYIAALASDVSAWPWHRARLQLAYGRWLRRHRQVARSRDPLRAALLQFEELNAPTWAAEARNELDATAHRTERDRKVAPALSSLSAQELAIARLVAAGLSNSEIGQQLTLSPRTVGSHLYRLFPKLGITARGEIAARLAPVELVAR